MRTPPPGTLALAVAASNNSKIGAAATTYAAQTSCPSSCVFFDGGGCYAESGATGVFVTTPLNKAARARPHTPLDVAQAEADAIDGLCVRPGTPLRLHTVGDCASDAAAALVAAAAARYEARGGGPVWTYTHAWRTVRRSSWGAVNVFASCETPLDVAEARARGYATALVVEEFPTDRRYDEDTVQVVPCPSQTRGRTCTSCRLCFNDTARRDAGVTIGFAVHGDMHARKKARHALRDPHDPDRKLTSRDHALAWKAEHGRWPTTRELMHKAGVDRSSAFEMLTRLRAEL